MAEFRVPKLPSSFFKKKRDPLEIFASRFTQHGVHVFQPEEIKFDGTCIGKGSFGMVRIADIWHPQGLYPFLFLTLILPHVRSFKYLQALFEAFSSAGSGGSTVSVDFPQALQYLRNL